MLPGFQSILDLAPTEQWRCSLRSKYNYIEIKVYNSWGSVIFIPSASCKLAVENRLCTKFRLALDSFVMRTSISYKLCCFRVGLWTRFWRSLWSPQNEIQHSVLLKLAHAASKRCRKSKSKGRITFCAPECFSWSTWHSAVGCVFRFVGSKFGKHHLHTTMKLFQDVPRIGSAKMLEDIYSMKSIPESILNTTFRDSFRCSLWFMPSRIPCSPCPLLGRNCRGDLHFVLMNCILNQIPSMQRKRRQVLGHYGLRTTKW